MTDVLGMLEAWAGGVASVRTAAGDLVAIRTSDIVSGKPVPPRPSVRQRVSVLEAERRTARLWPGVQVESLGDWSLRHEDAPAGRRRKRANSCLAVGDPGVPLDEAATRVIGHYAGLGLEPLVQVELDSSEESFFADRGWAVVPGGDAHFLLGSVSRARRLAGPAPDLSATGDLRVEGGDGVVEGTVDGDWLGIHGLFVEEGSRRRGVARGLLAVLLEGAAERGVTNVWLHVETDNQGAIRLYEGLGFTIHHTCRYLAAP